MMSRSSSMRGEEHGSGFQQGREGGSSMLLASCYLLSTFHGFPFYIVVSGVFAVGSFPVEAAVAK